MSSPQDSGTQRVSLDKAQEGARLLSTGDYHGAIAACTDAINLDPGSIGARRTRAEAYRRSGRKIEAEADLKILSDRSGNYEEGDPRPVFCARLGRLGVRARPAGRKKRGVGGGDEWLIDVPEGPIRQVLISNLLDPEGYGAYSEFVRRIDYLVPDSRIGPNFSRRGVNSVVVPWIWSDDEIFEYVRITGHHFTGGFNSVRAEAISRLSRFTEAAAKDKGVTVRFDPDRSCWWLTEGVWREREIRHWTGLDARQPNLADAVAERAPSRLQWNGYQAIASQVLEAPVLVAYLVDRQPTEGLCAALRNLGVDANVMEQDPFTEESGVRWVQKGVDPLAAMGQDPYADEPRWVQIADGPIRWVELGLGTLKAKADFRLTSFLSATGEGLGFGTLCYVPDARLTPDSPRVRIVSERVKSFPLFGRVKRVQWEFPNDHRHYLPPDFAVPGQTQRDRDFSLRVSESLGRDPAATEAINSGGAELCVVTDPDCGCWILAANDRPMTKWTRPLWDCCQAVAERLLAMPIPAASSLQRSPRVGDRPQHKS